MFVEPSGGSAGGPEQAAIKFGESGNPSLFVLSGPSGQGHETVFPEIVAQEFGMHTVSLRRELHDWDAIFAFTQSPNGNFAFNFFIALRAQPELKFNYDRRSYKRTPGGFQ